MAKHTTSRAGWTGLAVLIAIVLAGVVGAKDSPPPRSPDASGPLDGLVFFGETGREGGDRVRLGRFVFEDGKFSASAFAAYGFSDAAYESGATDDAMDFTAAVVGQSSGGGAMHWTGTLHAGVLEGTMRWDHGWESKRYWFRGRVQDAPIAD